MSELQDIIVASSVKAFNAGYQHGLTDTARPGSFVNIAFDTGFIAGINFALDAAEFVSHPDDNDHDMLSLQDLKEEIEDRRKEATRRANESKSTTTSHTMEAPQQEGN